MLLLGQKEEIAEHKQAFKGFQVDGDLMRATSTDKTMFLHSLRTERGREHR